MWPCRRELQLVCFSICRGAFARSFLLLILKLAVIPFLLEELDVVVFAVELSLMSNVVGRAYDTSTMSALEAASVISCSIHSDLHRRLKVQIA